MAKKVFPRLIYVTFEVGENTPIAWNSLNELEGPDWDGESVAIYELKEEGIVKVGVSFEPKRIVHEAKK